LDERFENSIRNCCEFYGRLIYELEKSLADTESMLHQAIMQKFEKSGSPRGWRLSGDEVLECPARIQCADAGGSV